MEDQQVRRVAVERYGCAGWITREGCPMHGMVALCVVSTGKDRCEWFRWTEGVRDPVGTVALCAYQPEKTKVERMGCSEPFDTACCDYDKLLKLCTCDKGDCDFQVDPAEEPEPKEPEEPEDREGLDPVLCELSDDCGTCCHYTSDGECTRPPTQAADMSICATCRWITGEDNNECTRPLRECEWMARVEREAEEGLPVCTVPDWPCVARQGRYCHGTEFRRSREKCPEPQQAQAVNAVDCAEGYEVLAEVLNAAFDRAASGKGRRRHANGKPFLEQQIMALQRDLSSQPMVYQVCKKAMETQRLEPEAAYREWLDIIVHAAAGAIYCREAQNHEEQRDE